MTQVSVDLPLRCQCGGVRGVAHEVSPSAGIRFVCYCTDRQTFSRFLGRPDVLDAAGGTDIFHMPVGRVQITAGLDALRCVRLSSKVLRWHTACCGTPVGNTATDRRFPVFALIHCFIGDAADGRSHDAVLGPQLCRIFEGSATRALPPTAPPPPSFASLLHRVRKLLGWWWRGLAKPNPFFDDGNAPVAQPRTLTRDERAALWVA
jgi:Family of unknown function (DUF6151)